MTPQDWELTELASGFTVADYKAAAVAKNRDAIAEALRNRFKERYIEPVSSKGIHGFTIMAISCLMIESIESFRRGWENSNGKSEVAFCYFFDSHRQFDGLRTYFAGFYKHVRCGILHQAETTGGWKITRKTTEPLFNPATLTINAALFLQELRAVLDSFCDDLKTAEWTSAEWKSVNKKMKALCANCGQ